MTRLTALECSTSRSRIRTAASFTLDILPFAKTKISVRVNNHVAILVADCSKHIRSPRRRPIDGEHCDFSTPANRLRATYRALFLEPALVPPKPFDSSPNTQSPSLSRCQFPSNRNLRPPEKQLPQHVLDDSPNGENIIRHGFVAAIAAGYSENEAKVAGHRLLTNVNVRAELEAQTTELLDTLGVKASYALGGIMETIERCKPSPVLDRKGKPVMVETDRRNCAAYTFNALGALKGYELLGKHLKLWTEKVEQIGSDGKPLDAVKVILIGATGRCLERPSHPTSSST